MVVSFYDLIGQTLDTTQPGKSKSAKDKRGMDEI